MYLPCRSERCRYFNPQTVKCSHKQVFPGINLETFRGICELVEPSLDNNDLKEEVEENEKEY